MCCFLVLEGTTSPSKQPFEAKGNRAAKRPSNRHHNPDTAFGLVNRFLHDLHVLPKKMNLVHQIANVSFQGTELLWVYVAHVNISIYVVLAECGCLDL
jgi:hypothetical protein